MDDHHQRTNARHAAPRRSLRRRAIAPAAGVLSGALVLLGSVSAASATTPPPVSDAATVAAAHSPALTWTGLTEAPAGAGRLTDALLTGSTSGIEPELVGDVTPSFETGDLPPMAQSPLFSTFRLPSSSRGLPRPASAAAAATALSSTGSAKLPWFVAPVPGPVTSAFGPRMHPILHYVRLHNGVDMTAPCGQPVVAAAAGRVSFAGRNGGYGNLVVVDHGLVDGHRLQTKYAHLSAIGVRVGQAVTPGTGVGLSGTTGLSTGCHLHFEVKSDGIYVNPVPYLTGKPAPAPIAPIIPVGATSTAPGLLSATPTPTATWWTTGTPTPTASATATAKPSATASATPRPSATASASPKPSPSSTPTAQPTTPAPTTPPPAPEPTDEPAPEPSSSGSGSEPSSAPSEPAEPSAAPSPQAAPSTASATPSSEPEEG